MKNTRTYPFERNRYFYGKLLTVRDFESEQKYFNDKRRLLNRLMFGSGVLAGMQVVAVDDKSITVEMGVGLDSLGREIVVPSPVTHKLSTIEGFNNNEYAKNVYLCIAYDEKGREPVHSIANSSIRGEEVSEYNRWLESYRLFVREEAPDLSILDEQFPLYHHALIYEEGDIRIWQRAPRYVREGEMFEVELHLEKTLQTPRLGFEFEVESDRFEPVHQDTPKIIFQEPKDSQETEYIVHYAMKAGPESNVRGSISIKRGSKLTVGDKTIEISSSGVNITEVVDKSIREQLLQQYFERTLDESLHFTSEPCIYLAKISLLQIESTYMIEQVHPLPFQEQVLSNKVLSVLQSTTSTESSSVPFFSVKSKTEILDHDEEPKASLSYDQRRQQFNFEVGLPRPKQLREDIATGIAEITLDQNEKSGLFFLKSQKSYFSDEIEHGLGAGNVYVYVGLEDDNKYLSNEAPVIFGDADVFSGSDFEPKLSKVNIGTILYPEKGTFRIGIKTHRNEEVSSIRFKWWAFKTDEALFQTASFQEAASTEKRE